MLANDPVTGLAVRLEIDPPLLRAGEPVQWTFAVANNADQARKLTFASAQQGDVVLEAGGVEQYRWSQGKLFATVIGEKELAAGEEWAFELDDVLSVEPGTYSLLATVTAQPAPPPIRAEVSVLSPE